MRRLTTAFGLTLFLASAAGAQHTVTFSQYASPVTTEYAAAIGDPVRAGGLAFYETGLFNGSSSRNVLGTWGNDPSDPGYINRPTNIGSSTAMFATVLGLEIDIYGGFGDPVTGNYGTPFDLYSIDVGHLYSNEYAPFTLATINLTFSGFGPGTGGTTITQAFSVPVPALNGNFRYPQLTTLTFDNRWRDLNNVWWFQGSGSGSAHQFTNLVASVPEPGTYALVATGLVAVAGVARRRRAV
jgi:hypothetical protein